MYVTVEGIDGSGTTTVSRRLANALTTDDRDVLLTTEPFDREWHGEAVREALSRDTSDVTDLFLFLADRAEHLEHRVRPALADGTTVVSDRGHDSTYAYQRSRVEDVVPNPWDWFDRMYEPWNLTPDLTLYLDVSVETAMERMDGDEKYETEENLREVQTQYDHLATRLSDRYAVINADRPLDKVVADCTTVTRRAMDAPMSIEDGEVLTALEAQGRLPDSMEAP